MREKQIEQRLVKAVKARGGLCPKLVSPKLPERNRDRFNSGGMSNCGNWDIRFQFSTILNKSPQSWTRYGGDRDAQCNSTEVRKDRNSL